MSPASAGTTRPAEAKSMTRQSEGRLAVTWAKARAERALA